MLTNGLQKLCSVLLGTVLGVTTPPASPSNVYPWHARRGSGGGEPDLSISISHTIQCIVTLRSEVKIRSAILWSLVGRKPAVFYQPGLSQQPVPQHTHLGFSADAPRGVPEPEAEQYPLSSPGAELAALPFQRGDL